MTDDYAELIGADLTPQRFVQRALALLERDFREFALVALADWDRTGLASIELFQAVSGLQRPSWGSWNGLLIALRSARKAVLRGGSAADRERVEAARLLADALAVLDGVLEPDRVTALAPLGDLVRIPVRARARRSVAFSLPIALRNRVVHDAPADDAWWSSAAAALKPLVGLHSESAPLRPILAQAVTAPPWLVLEDQELWAWNGLQTDLSVVYVSRRGATRTSEPSREALLALERLLGRTSAQERDVRALLARWAPEELKGVVMGDLLVGRQVGEGGFARVHVGRQLSTGRKVAIKVLKEGLGDDVKARFQQEAAFLSLFHNPNIVSVLGYGEDVWTVPRHVDLAGEPWFDAFSEGSPSKTWIALEWVDGATLEEVYRQGGVDPRRLAGWMAQAAGALATVHASGLVHRDVKPGNIMLAGDTIKLMDFGIARSQGEVRTIVTSAGGVLGTPPYMSPEQIRARDAEASVGPASDVYSLSCTFYELFTRTRIYGHDSAEPGSVETRKLRGEPPIRPRALLRSLPWEIETILLGGLETEVVDRYPSAAALESDLRRFLRDEPIEHRRPSLVRRARLGYRRNRVLANTTGAFVCLVVALTLLFVRSLSAARDEESRQKDAAIAATGSALAAERATARARDAAIAAETSAVREATRANVEEFRARVGLVESAIRGVWEQRERARAAADRPTGLQRALTDAAAVLHDARAAGLLRSRFAGQPSGPERDELIKADHRLDDVRRSAVELQRVIAHELAPRAGLPAVFGPWFSPSCAAFSPDGEQLLVGSRRGALALWDLARGEPVQMFEGHTDHVSACAFTPDGREILSASHDMSLKLWDRETGRLVRTFVGHTGRVHTCAVSRDGRLIASAGGESLLLWDRDSGSVVKTLQQDRVSDGGCAFSPDGGEVLAIASNRKMQMTNEQTGRALYGQIGGTTAAWSVRTGRLLWRLEKAPGGVQSCQYSPDGRLVLIHSTPIIRTAGVETRSSVTLHERATGATVRTFPVLGPLVQACTYSPAGDTVVAASGPVLEVWDASTGERLTSLTGHESPVVEVSYSLDGRRLVSVAEDGSLRVWEARGGPATLTFAGRRPSGPCVFSRDGSEILASTDEGVELRERGSGLLVRAHSLAGRVTACALTPDGQQLLSATADGALQLSDRWTGQTRWAVHAHERSITALAFSPSGDVALTASEDRTLKLWDAASGAAICTFQGHDGAVICCAVSPDGTEVLSGATDKRAGIWTRTGSLVRWLEGHEGPITACVYAGESIVTGSADRTLRVWDRSIGETMAILEGHEGPVTACAYRKDERGEEVLSAAEDGTLRLWDPTTGSLVRTVRGPGTPVVAASFAPDGREILCATKERTVELWSRSSVGEPLQVLEPVSARVVACEVSPEGRFYAVASDDGQLQVREAIRGGLVTRLAASKRPVFACSPEGTELLVATDETGVLALREPGGRLLRSFSDSADAVGPLTACTFSPDGRRVVSATLRSASSSPLGVVQVWERSTGRLLRNLRAHSEAVTECAISPDGKLLATSSTDKSVRLWDLETGRLVRALGHPEAVNACRFSPDSRELLSACADRVLRSWDVSTGRPLRRFEGHAGSIKSCAFSPDGREVLSASDDQTLRLWDRSTATLVQTFRGHGGPVTACAFSPDGRTILSGADDRSLLLWRSPASEPGLPFDEADPEPIATAERFASRLAATGAFGAPRLPRLVPLAAQAQVEIPAEELERRALALALGEARAARGTMAQDLLLAASEAGSRRATARLAWALERGVGGARDALRAGRLRELAGGEEPAVPWSEPADPVAVARAAALGDVACAIRHAESIAPLSTASALETLRRARDQGDEEASHGHARLLETAASSRADLADCCESWRQAGHAHALSRARCEARLARLLLAEGDEDAAAGHVDIARAILELLGRERQSDLAVAEEFASIVELGGEVRLTHGDEDGAREAFEFAARQREWIVQADPGRRGSVSALFACLARLQDVLTYNLQVAHSKRVFEVARGLWDAGQRPPELVGALARAARLHAQDLEESAEAIQVIDLARAVAEHQAAIDPEEDEWVEEMALAQLELARLHQSEGRLAEAIDHARAAVAPYELLVERGSKRAEGAPAAYAELVAALSARGALVEAAVVNEELLRLHRTPDTALRAMELASATGHGDAVLARYDRLIDRSRRRITDEAPPEDRLDLSRVLLLRGRIRADLGAFAAAREDITAARAIRGQLAAAPGAKVRALRVGEAERALADLHAACGEADAAVAGYLAALELSSEASDRTVIFERLGHLQLARGDVAAATSWLGGALARRPRGARAPGLRRALAEVDELAVAQRKLEAGVSPVTSKELLARARAHAVRGEARLALESFGRAIGDATETGPALLEEAARVALAGGAIEQATVWLRVCLERQRARFDLLAPLLCSHTPAPRDLDALIAERDEIVARWVRIRWGDPRISKLRGQPDFVRLVEGLRPGPAWLELPALTPEEHAARGIFLLLRPGPRSLRGAALASLRVAAGRGSGRAAAHLAFALRRGLGTPRDAVLADQLARQGQGQPLDPACDVMERASAGGDLETLARAAALDDGPSLLQYGCAVAPIATRTALRCLRRAAELGSEGAWEHLASLEEARASTPEELAQLCQSWERAGPRYTERHGRAELRLATVLSEQDRSGATPVEVVEHARRASDLLSTLAETPELLQARAEAERLVAGPEAVTGVAALTLRAWRLAPDRPGALESLLDALDRRTWAFQDGDPASAAGRAEDCQLASSLWSSGRREPAVVRRVARWASAHARDLEGGDTLERALECYSVAAAANEHLRQQLPDRLATQVELGQAQLGAARALQGLDRPHEAVLRARQAVSTFDHLCAVDEVYRPSAAAARETLAIALEARGALAEASRVSAERYALLETGEDLVRLSNAALCAALYAQGVAQVESAAVWYDVWIETSKRRLDLSPTDLGARLDASSARIMRGDLLTSLGELDRAAEDVVPVVELRRGLAREKPDDSELRRRLGNALLSLGKLRQARQEHEAAMVAYAEAREIRAALAAVDSSRTSKTRELAEVEEAMSRVEAARGDREAAARWAQSALTLRERCGPAYLADALRHTTTPEDPARAALRAGDVARALALTSELLVRGKSRLDEIAPFLRADGPLPPDLESLKAERDALVARWVSIWRGDRAFAPLRELEEFRALMRRTRP